MWLVRTAIVLVAATLVLRHVRRGGDVNADPVGVLQTVAMRYPVVRHEIPVERLGPACDGGDSAACVQLGRGVAATNQAGPMPRCLEQAFYRKACAADDWEGCAALAGGGSEECGPVDVQAIRDSLDRACRRMVFAACDVKVGL
jgi:hypothetical protein